MMNANGRPRRVLAATLGAVCLVLAVPAMAATELQWRRQLGTENTDRAYGVATDAAGNVYLTGRTIDESDDPIDAEWAWVAKYDAAGHALWKRQQLGTVETVEARGVATDAAGNVYLTGSTYGSFGSPSNHFDAWLVKYDAAGHVLWKRQLGSKGYDFAFGVATDAAGNIYLTGETSGSLGGPRHGYYDAWVAKYDAAGHLLWKRQLGTPEWERATGVATDAAGDVYIAGWTKGTLAGPIRGSSDAWVAKYNTAGHLLWKRQFGTGRSDHAEGVATDAAGNVYVTGYAGVWNSTVDHAWVVKYDAAGHELWTRQLGKESGAYAFGVATDAAGNVYITGSTGGSLGGTQRGWGDAWVAKYDAAGEVLWKRQLGSEDSDAAYDVATDAAGNVYLTGETRGSLGGPNRGSYDAWVAKYSAD